MKLVLEAHEAALRDGRRAGARSRVHRPAHGGVRRARRGSARARAGRTSCAVSGSDASADRARRRRSTWAPKPPSSATGWASPSIGAAPRPCSRSPICCCCAAISAGPARASARCAATPTSRATARWASTKSRARSCSSSIEKVVRLRAAARHGHAVVGAIKAMLDGRAKVFIGLGGNFVARDARHGDRRGGDAPAAS